MQHGLSKTKDYEKIRLVVRQMLIFLAEGMCLCLPDSSGLPQIIGGSPKLPDGRGLAGIGPHIHTNIICA